MPVRLLKVGPVVNVQGAGVALGQLAVLDGGGGVAEAEDGNAIECYYYYVLALPCNGLFQHCQNLHVVEGPAHESDLPDALLLALVEGCHGHAAIDELAADAGARADLEADGGPWGPPWYLYKEVTEHHHTCLNESPAVARLHLDWRWTLLPLKAVDAARDLTGEVKGPTTKLIKLFYD